MDLSIDSIQKAGGFTGAPVKREVTWNIDGQEFTADVYVRRLSYQAAVGDAESLAKGGEIPASRIANSICDESGKAVFTVADVTGFHPDGSPVMTKDDDGNEVQRGALDHSLTFALLTVIGEVNNLGKGNDS